MGGRWWVGIASHMHLHPWCETSAEHALSGHSMPGTRLQTRQAQRAGVGARQDVQASAEALCVRVSHYEVREHARTARAPCPSNLAVSLCMLHPFLCSTPGCREVYLQWTQTRCGAGSAGSAGQAHARARQVYNECLYDLLDEASVGGLGPRPRLQVKEDAHSRVFVAGLSEARACAPGWHAPAK